MNRNKKKIIRAVTVSNSIDFFKEVMVKQKDDGYETVVVTSPGRFLDEFRAECPDFKTIEVPMERHISLVKDVKALMKMIWVFLKERPFVVHSMTPKAGLLSMVAAKLTGVPIRIHTFTGLVWPSLTGKRRKLLMTTDKILCSCATHVIPEGQGVLNDLKNNGVCKKQMKVLGYGNVMGVDMERFNPKRFNLNKDERTFIYTFVGRIVGDKGINELVEAFMKLNEKYPHTKLKLIGRYETELDPVSELTQDRIKANKNIIVAGQKFGDELLEEFVTSECHVMPSYREGFPNTVLEAGAMGLPQIVTDINGSREIVTYLNPNANHNIVGKMDIRDNGIVIPSKDVDALYEAMEMMIVNDEMRQNMEINARPMIESRFEKRFVQGCQIQYYSDLLS